MGTGCRSPAVKENTIMNVLVIGGAGYIGSHVVRALLQAGHRVTVFDNLSTGHTGNLFPDAAFVQGDIQNPASLQEVFSRGFDGCVHLAAFKAVGESMEHPGKYAENNISGTINILNAAVGTGCMNLVFSSSAAVFGSPCYVPIDEKHPTKPESFYGFTKLEIEHLLEWYDRLKGLRYAALRYFNAAGYDPSLEIRGLERNPQNLIPIIMETAMGWRPGLKIYGRDYDTRDGTCIRDYIHVTDLADAHVRALEHLYPGGESLTVNLGSDTGATVTEILEAARRITGRPIPASYVGRRAGDTSALYAESSLARIKLGWSPVLSHIDTIIQTTWQVYQSWQDRRPYNE